MIDHDDMRLILGPPGTGKTTKLLSILEQELEQTPPTKVGFVSFTRKAASEAKERAFKKFRLDEHSVPWFRTLHSMAYRCLALSPDDVFDRSDCIELGKALGLFISFNTSSDDDSVICKESKGTEMLFLDNLSRIRCEHWEDTWRQFATDRISYSEMEHFVGSIAQYKQEKCVVDFTDMIYRVAEDPAVFCPKLDVLIVDEAQDLTRIQWKMIKRLAQYCKRLYIAGDDDQAIYEWSGADVKTFLALRASNIYSLSVSYRCPLDIYNVANDIAQRISSRYTKNWKPRNGERGEIHAIFQQDEAPLSTGNWLILARNKCFAEEWATYCWDRGLHFTSNFADSVDPTMLQAVRLWERLRRGKKICGAEVRTVYRWMRVGSGVARGQKQAPGLEDTTYVRMEDLMSSHGLRTKAIWHEALELMPMSNREHLIAVLKNGEKIDNPRIHISTIHGAKGGEAENVLLCCDMARRSYDTYNTDPDAEHRVFYVGVTRAKRRLFLFQPTTPRFYPISIPKK